MAIFRKKSLEELDSPERLDDFIEVAPLRAWIVLLGAVLFVVVLVCLVATLFNLSIF